MMVGMGDLIKQAKQMQEQMAKVKEEMVHTVVEGTAGGGAIVVVMNGEKRIQSIRIKPEVFQHGDVEMMQDLIMTAVNGAMKKIDDHLHQNMSKITGGVSIPGLF